MIRFMPCGTNQIKGQRSCGQRFNGSPKLNVRAQIRSKVTCPRLIPAMSSIETSLLNSVYYIISLILETLISHFLRGSFSCYNHFFWVFKPVGYSVSYWKNHAFVVCESILKTLISCEGTALQSAPMKFTFYFLWCVSFITIHQCLLS